MPKQTQVLTGTIATIVGVVIGGAFLGAVWVPGVGLVALVALIALFVILVQGAKAMNQPNNFGQGLTAVLAALFLLPAAIAAAIFIGISADFASSFEDGFEDGGSIIGDMTYDECILDSSTTFEECEELE